MAEHADHALQAAVKALSEVVAPAVDPQDPLAVDQLRLVVSWLQFDATRRHQERGLVQAELALRIALADAALPLVTATHAPRASALALSLAQARELHARADADTAAWRAAADGLDGLVSDAVADGAGGSALAGLVLQHAHDSLMIRRAWFAPLGFEARPDAVPAFETLLAGRTAR